MVSNLRAERGRLGLTIEEVANQIGVNKNLLQRWESGETKPSAINLINLSSFYNCTPDYLLGLVDERKQVIRDINPGAHLAR